MEGNVLITLEPKKGIRCSFLCLLYSQRKSEYSRSLKSLGRFPDSDDEKDREYYPDKFLPMAYSHGTSSNFARTCLTSYGMENGSG